MEFPELLISGGLELAEGRNFCNYLGRAGGAVAITKQWARHRSKIFNNLKNHNMS